MKRQILYIDMDGVIVDFMSGVEKQSMADRAKYGKKVGDIPGVFKDMRPMPGAIDAVNELVKHYDVYILTHAPWGNPSAWIDKLNWIQKYFGIGTDSILRDRLIIAGNKSLLRGDYLIDDRPKHGASEFKGKWIKFDAEKCNWSRVMGLLVPATAT